MMSPDVDAKSDSEVEESDRPYPVILQSPRGMSGNGHLVRARHTFRLACLETWEVGP